VLGRVVATGILAVLAGIAFSLRDLVLLPPRLVPLPLEDLVLVGWVLGLLAIGWVAAQLLDPSAGLVAAPAVALAAVAVTLVAKQLRYPAAPLTGDGFEILIWVWALIGLIGAALGSYPPLRMRSRRVAAAAGAGLLAVAGAVSAVPYVLARP
jgi:hypothetical protein